MSPPFPFPLPPPRSAPLIQQPTPRYDTKAQEPTHARAHPHPPHVSLPRPLCLPLQRRWGPPPLPATGRHHRRRQPRRRATLSSWFVRPALASFRFSRLAVSFFPARLIRPLRCFLDEQCCSRRGAAVRRSSPRNSTELQPTGMGSRRLGTSTLLFSALFRASVRAYSGAAYEQRSRALFPLVVKSPFSFPSV
jgi:hypothetical protein